MVLVTPSFRDPSNVARPSARQIWIAIHRIESIEQERGETRITMVGDGTSCWHVIEPAEDILYAMEWERMGQK